VSELRYRGRGGCCRSRGDLYNNNNNNFFADTKGMAISLVEKSKTKFGMSMKNIYTVDPHLSAPHSSAISDYPENF